MRTAVSAPAAVAAQPSPAADAASPMEKKVLSLCLAQMCSFLLSFLTWCLYRWFFGVYYVDFLPTDTTKVIVEEQKDKPLAHDAEKRNSTDSRPSSEEEQKDRITHIRLSPRGMFSKSFGVL